MIVLSGATLVLPDRLLGPGTMVLDGGRIADIRPGGAPHGGHHGSTFAFHDHYIVPGFVDAHVHGLDGVDTLDDGDAVAAIARGMPRYGVTAFCPTAVACPPAALRALLAQVARAREDIAPASARVLPAHLESPFVNPDYRGAQPLACLRAPREALAGAAGDARGRAEGAERRHTDEHESFAGRAILDEIERAPRDVGVVTLAPELDGALALVEWLTARGIRVSLGHSAATFDEAMAAVACGARQATHLFNRMPPLDHRAPGLAGAVLQAEEIAAEIIGDGCHVHPAMIHVAVAAKRPSRVMAITDGTSLSGRPPGSRGRLGGQIVVARDQAARLANGTLAGSTATMDGVFRRLVTEVGLSPVDAVALCATTPARESGLFGHGALVPGAPADLVVLDARFAVVQTYIGGQLAYQRAPTA